MKEMLGMKAILGFLAGVVVASGLGYMFLHKNEAPAISSISAEAPVAQAVPVEVPALLPTPTPVEQPDPAPLARRKHAPAVVVTKYRHTSEYARSNTTPIQEPVQTPVQPSMPPQPPLPAAENVKVLKPDPLEVPKPSEPRQPHRVTLAAGTLLSVRLAETISTKLNQAGDSFMATLDQPLTVDGFVIAERGARLEGRIVNSARAPRMSGSADLALELVKLTTSDGQRISISTASFDKRGGSPTKTRDAAIIGGGAAIGAAIGAIAGGGKGAAIGAGVGGAAGAGDVVLTRGKDVELPVETRLTFRLQEPVTVSERLR